MIEVGLPDSVTVVDTKPGMPRLRIATPEVVGEVYLQGAHITEWTPAGQRPVLWMSQASAFERGAAIRGGIPICFPWFGPGRNSEMSSLHGFARLADWSLTSAVELDDVVTLTFRLTHADIAGLPGADAWRYEFELTYEVIFNAELTLVLTVRNTGPSEFFFEEAFHSYFAVEDIEKASIEGLTGAHYLDKTAAADANILVQEGSVTFREETERVYYSTAPATIDDPQGNRSIRISSYGSSNTVVWNPWQAKAAAMSDFDSDRWPSMVCVETANTREFAKTLRPGAAHAVAARYAVHSPVANEIA